MVEKEIVINGHKIRYGEKQSDDASVVYVFLHGWGSDYTIFEPLFNIVSCAIAPDFPGFGGSSPLKEPWTLATYAATLREYIEKKRGGRKVVFVAHSFGGRVLLQMLSQQSKVAWVERVICIGIPFTRKRTAGQNCMQAILQAAKGTLQLVPGPIGEKMREWGYDVLGAEDYRALTSEVMRKTFQHIINADIEYLAQSLNNYNTIFIWGTDDDAAPIKDAEVIAHKIGATIHPIENGDHFPFLGETEGAFRSVFKKNTTI